MTPNTGTCLAYRFNMFSESSGLTFPCANAAVMIWETAETLIRVSSSGQQIILGIKYNFINTATFFFADFHAANQIQCFSRFRGLLGYGLRIGMPVFHALASSETLGKPARSLPSRSDTACAALQDCE